METGGAVGGMSVDGGPDEGGGGVSTVAVGEKGKFLEGFAFQELNSVVRVEHFYGGHVGECSEVFIKAFCSRG